MYLRWMTVAEKENGITKRSAAVGSSAPRLVLVVDIQAAPPAHARAASASKAH